jgi:hypothetical protein
MGVEKLYFNKPDWLDFSYRIDVKKKYKNIILMHRVLDGMKNHIEWLKHLKSKCDKLIFWDDNDCAGICFQDYLQYVDEYWKEMIYKDLKLYNNKYYLDNIYADWLVKKFKLKKQEYIMPFNKSKISKKDFKKIKLSWNLGMTDNLLYENSFYDRLYRKLRLKKYENPKIVYPRYIRNHDINLRFYCNYDYNVFKFHRDLVFKNLPNANLPNITYTGYNRIPRKQYIEEIKQSKIMISPFGYGEVCYRDYEAVLYGACLVKPSMEHVKTYPNIYKPWKTYVPVKWDFSDLKKTLQYLLDNPKIRIEIARNAQKEFMKFKNIEYMLIGLLK